MAEFTISAEFRVATHMTEMWRNISAWTRVADAALPSATEGYDFPFSVTVW
ncbi:hypothetical protein ABZ702_17605 [Streptomyces cyaneofuscatus]|uniref:hypothetical protein n=1 Tax=Streptomyces cyaneofuscatus TaxID=66883 RepID=UPI0033C28F23